MSASSPISTPKNNGGRPQDSIRSLFDISDVDESGKVDVSCTLCGESWRQAGGSRRFKLDKLRLHKEKHCKVLMERQRKEAEALKKLESRSAGETTVSDESTSAKQTHIDAWLRNAVGNRGIAADASSLFFILAHAMSRALYYSKLYYTQQLFVERYGAHKFTAAEMEASIKRLKSGICLSISEIFCMPRESVAKSSTSIRNQLANAANAAGG